MHSVAIRQDYYDSIPLNRYGTPEEIAASDFGTNTRDEYFDDLFRLTSYRTDSELSELLVTRSLDEDLGRAGDVTSIATIAEGVQARAVVVARAGGVIAGLPFVAATFQKLAPDIETSASLRDGAIVAPRTTLMRLSGPARAVLAAERTALNLLGRFAEALADVSDCLRLAPNDDQALYAVSLVELLHGRWREA